VTLLVVFAGLPGSGKSVLSRGVADAIGATYLRIDSIESAIAATLMPFRDNPVGYVIAERIAADQLAGGRDVVADAVNGVAAARGGTRRTHRRRADPAEPGRRGPGRLVSGW
jgi:predicted kinase